MMPTCLPRRLRWRSGCGPLQLHHHTEGLYIRSRARTPCWCCACRHAPRRLTTPERLPRLPGPCRDLHAVLSCDGHQDYYRYCAVSLTWLPLADFCPTAFLFHGCHMPVSSWRQSGYRLRKFWKNKHLGCCRSRMLVPVVPCFPGSSRLHFQGSLPPQPFAHTSIAIAAAGAKRDTDGKRGHVTAALICALSISALSNLHTSMNTDSDHTL